jgi:predicted MPP superfamily phosphohydrolase
MPVLAILVLGHIGLWIALFNRINATGLHRKQIKAIEKGIVLVCLLLPIALLYVDWFNEPESSKLTAWSQYFMGYGRMPNPSIWSLAYAMIAIGYGVIAGPLWLMYRPQFHTARDRLGVLETTIDKHLDRRNPSWQLGSKARKSLRLPGNQLMHLEANVKALRLDSIPERFVGMRIGHLSDIHLTGQLPDEFYRHALDWLVSQRIELLCLSGDIIDKHQAVPSLPVIFGNLAPDIPKLFVLGNHDRACQLDQTVRRIMCDLNWIDVGQADRTLHTDRGTLKVLGNERPWFRRELTPGVLEEHSMDQEFRLGISHSPDQYLWARKLDVSLLLCGHTHGGQIRFPWIGPVIAPSKYGSRFASGVFYQKPTLMHVSRGLSGVHTIRLGCLPEVSVLELRKKS